MSTLLPCLGMRNSGLGHIEFHLIFEVYFLGSLLVVQSPVYSAVKHTLLLNILILSSLKIYTYVYILSNFK